MREVELQVVIPSHATNSWWSQDSEASTTPLKLFLLTAITGPLNLHSYPPDDANHLSKNEA